MAAERTCNYVIGICGNKPLSDYTRHDALQFRDWLVARGLTGSSVTRNFSHLKAVINFALSEYALDVRNPFVGVYHGRLTLSRDRPGRTDIAKASTGECEMNCSTARYSTHYAKLK